MTPLALTVVLVVIGLVTALTGLAWISAPFFVLAAIAFLWALVTFGRGETQMPVMHRTRKPELLGPGGPDDPDRGA
jgi:hypothetical protein